MTADDMYTIVGSPTGATNDSGGSTPPDDGTPIGSSVLSYVSGVTVDSAGNLYLVDNQHDVVQEVPSSLL